MKDKKLLLITGLPASGKSTLARELAQRYGVPVIAKDSIKEPLLDVLGAETSAASRRLSDASFAATFAIAHELITARVSFVLEGNFRRGEHEAHLDLRAVSVAQVLCRVDEALRLQRLAARSTDAARHPGHRDAQQIGTPGMVSDDFLSIPGERLLYEGERSLGALDAWWRR